jgi:hypothetical protein
LLYQLSYSGDRFSLRGAKVHLYLNLQKELLDFLEIFPEVILGMGYKTIVFN